MADSRETIRRYKRQLDDWIEQTGESQKELAFWTKYFFTPKSLSESAISNTKKAPPTRTDGRMNLYSLLGVLYLFEVVTEDDCLKFFTDFQIAWDEYASWNELWNQVLRGVNDARKAYNELLGTRGTYKAEVGNKKARKSQFKQDQTLNRVKNFRVGYRTILILTLLIFILVLFLLVRQPFNKSSWCEDAPSHSLASGTASRLYIDSAIPIDAFDKIPFYIYFNDVFVPEEHLDLEGLDPIKQQWIVRVSNKFAQKNSDWTEVKSWRIDYAC